MAVPRGDTALSDLPRRVIAVFGAHPAANAVRFVGSRATGTATALSDWDFSVETDDFDAMAQDVPDLAEQLRPLAHQWDPLGEVRTYMVMLAGAVKIDLIFGVPQEPAEPWDVAPGTLHLIDHHFWDWTLWLAAKRAAGRDDLVRDELRKQFRHILRPLGATDEPETIEAAVSAYTRLVAEAEQRLGVTVPRQLADDAVRRLRGAG